LDSREGYREDFDREQIERASNLDRKLSLIRKIDVVVIEKARF